MTYRELAPTPRLASAVQCIWLLEGTASPLFEPDPILPDGRPELIVHFGDAFERVPRAGERVRQPSLICAGQLTSQILLRPTGRIAVVGVRFHPHGASCLMAVPQGELMGLTVDLESVSADLASEFAAIEFSGDLVRAAEDVQRAIARWWVPDRIDPRVQFAVHAIERTRGLASVDAISRAANMTRRHLERRFLEDVGISPKRLGRIVRFQHALGMLSDRGAPQAGAETAAASGYSDQAHFIRDFRELAGCSPSQHLVRQAELTGFFVDRARSRANRGPV